MNRSISVLVHGESKAGKSMMAVSGAGPRLLLDSESAARFLPIKAVEWRPTEQGLPDLDPDQTAVVTVRDWHDAKAARDWLVSGSHPFRSVAIDSVSELQQRYVESVAGRGTVKIDQWGQIFREFGGFIRDLRDMTTHPVRPIETLVVTAMTKEVDGVYRPMVSGQLMANLPYYFDVVGWLYVDIGNDGSERRRMLTRKRGKFVAGERTGGRIPPIMDLPVIGGETTEQIASTNTTMRLMQSLVFPSAA